MSTGRPPLAAVPGLKRTESIPPPPPRRVTEAELTLSAESVRGDDISAALNLVTGGQHESLRAAGERTQKRSPKSVTVPPADTLRAVGISLPLSLANQLREHARTSARSQADTVLDAVLQQRDRLTSIVGYARAQPERDALFVRNPTKSPADEQHVSLSIRIRASNVDVLDRLVEEHHANSRSRLVAAALRGYLTSS